MLDSTNGYFNSEPEDHNSSISVYSGKNKECICSSEVGHVDAAPVENPSPPQVDTTIAINRPRRTRMLPSDDNMYAQLRIYYQNVRGLRTKIDELFVAATDVDYDVIVLTETWLNDQINSIQQLGPSYTIYRNDRDPSSTGKTRGGGVLIAVSNRLSSKRNTINNNGIEQLWVNIHIQDATICVGVVYLPPSSADDANVIQAHVDTALDITNSLEPNAVHLLFGDYKPGLIWKFTYSGCASPDPSESTFSRSSIALLDGMSILNMSQMCTVTNTRNRTLDLLFVNEEASKNCYIFEADEPLVDIDSHHPPLAVTQVCPQRISFDEILEDRSFNFSKADIPGLNNSLQNIDWLNLLNHAIDVDVAVDRFTLTLTDLFRVHVPAPSPRNKPPWSNRRLRQLKSWKAAALRHYTSRRNPFTKQEFIIASSNYKSYNRFLYSRHVSKTQSNLKRNPKSFWSFVNGKRKENGLPSSMFLADELESTPRDICDLFVKHFSSVFKKASACQLKLNAVFAMFLVMC
ncbi:uncharacterized protein LOC131680407 [Topomyia yanbarensis]|uniref:uncharacterized protein LOC131680407 n=1 Tax=Topomyia yanbarensis TaxID=2498891 RepID=UPI00273CCADF|nr:uncharacterized protein LOC131680407 [Topomyia yanbarensis]